MKKIVFLALGALLLAGCSQYDARRIELAEQNKRNYVEDVERARDGKLSRFEFRATLQSFDATMLEEEAKTGEGLEKMQETLKLASDSETERVFGGDEEPEEPEAPEEPEEPTEEPAEGEGDGA